MITLILKVSTFEAFVVELGEEGGLSFPFLSFPFVFDLVRSHTANQLLLTHTLFCVCSVSSSCVPPRNHHLDPFLPSLFLPNPSRNGHPTYPARDETNDGQGDWGSMEWGDQRRDGWVDEGEVGGGGKGEGEGRRGEGEGRELGRRRREEVSDLFFLLYKRVCSLGLLGREGDWGWWEE